MKNKSESKNKIIVILGPTSGGKTSLAVKLAHKYNGEIVSADSRQVYKGMDIGTGKDLSEYKIKSKVVSIPYHLIDIVSPKNNYSLARYQKEAFKAIDDILSRGGVPIIAGGSGLYLQAVVDNYNLSSAKPNRELREKLEKLSVDKLFLELKKINKKFAKKLNESEKKNKRRLIRYIEILKQVRLKEAKLPMGSLASGGYEYLLIGLTWPRKELCERIYKRLIDRIEREGMIEEVKRLHKEGVSWERLESFGLEYKFVSKFLKGDLEREEMIEKLNIAIRQFAKRQMTWFRRWEKQGKKIYWEKDEKKLAKLVENFLKKTA